MTIAWHEEARRLRREGLSIREIGRRLGHSDGTVRWALDENGARESARQRTRLARNREMVLRQPRAVKVLVSPEVKATAITAFAAGEITREELSKRLRGEA